MNAERYSAAAGLLGAILAYWYLVAPRPHPRKPPSAP